MCGIAEDPNSSQSSTDRADLDGRPHDRRRRASRARWDAASRISPAAISEQCERPIRAAQPRSAQARLRYRRLSILDLSDAGRQPMSYRDRLWLTYNGEIYNYLELRVELERLGT